MSEYVSADAFLDDARLRTDAFRSELLGILVVEGPDDKRFFYGRVQNPAQIMPTGGRRLLLASHAKASEEDLKNIIFVTDCDYAVRSGELAGGTPGLIITAGTTIESDILAMGTLPPVVMEVVPSAISSSRISRTCAEILRLATLMTLPVGRMRMAVQPLGVPVDLEEIDYSKYWNSRKEVFDSEKLLTVVGQKLRREGVSVDLPDLLTKIPPDNGMCNGKDLMRAIRFVLNSKFKTPHEISVSVLTKMIRLAVTDMAFEEWIVAKRIRRWEDANKRQLLVPPRR